MFAKLPDVEVSAAKLERWKNTKKKKKKKKTMRRRDSYVAHYVILMTPFIFHGVFVHTISIGSQCDAHVPVFVWKSIHSLAHTCIRAGVHARIFSRSAAYSRLIRLICEIFALNWSAICALQKSREEIAIKSNESLRSTLRALVSSKKKKEEIELYLPLTRPAQ